MPPHASCTQASGAGTASGNRVRLDNWQDADSVPWSFLHMRELMGSHRIPAGTPRPLPAGGAVDLASIELTRLSGERASVRDVLDTTHTDAVVVLHEGRLVHEEYDARQRPDSLHLVMSCSKSIVGVVAGILIDRGLLDPSARIESVVEDISGSGYEGATLRDLLDMRTGVAFSESYGNAEAEVRVMERSMGWRPRDAQDPLGAYAYMTTLGSEGAHGGTFTYRSADTDMLGWLCERVTGRRMADLISELVWQPIGAEFDAEITCDAVGTAIHDGGVSAAARDMARFGQMLLDRGTVDGRVVAPAWWVEDSFHPDTDVREAFAASNDELVLPGSWYRNQFWMIRGVHDQLLVCMGIHGQMVYVDPRTRLVAVKQSSWPTPQSAGYLVDTLRAFSSLGEHLSATPAGRPSVEDRPSLWDRVRAYFT